MMPCSKCGSEGHWDHQHDEAMSPAKTLRDEFAMAALAAQAWFPPEGVRLNRELVAMYAYQTADAMMRAREGK